MKRKDICLIASTVWMFTLTGCSSTRIITPNTDFTLLKNATLITTSGASLGIRYVEVIGDSILARDYSFDRDFHFHFSEIHKVVVKDHRKGSLIGSIGGAPVGFIWGFLFPNDEMVMVNAIMGAAFIGIAGGVTGGLLGDTETYLFRESKKIPVSSE